MVIQNGYGLVNGDDGAGVDPDNRFWNWDLYFGRCLDLYFGNTLDLYFGHFGDLYFGRLRSLRWSYFAISPVGR